jgi:cell division septal protein FtsQ
VSSRSRKKSEKSRSQLEREAARYSRQRRKARAPERPAKQTKSGGRWFFEREDGPVRTKPGKRADSKPARTKQQRRRRTAKEKQALRRKIVVATTIVLVATTLFAAWRVPRMDFFAVDQVEVTGTSAVSDLTVRKRMDKYVAGKTIYTADFDRIAKSVEDLPFVNSVQVDRHIPGGLTVKVTEYKPLAFGIVGTSGWLVAHDGRVLSKARLDDWSGRVPVVQLQHNDAKLGDRVGNEPALRLLALVPPAFPGTIKTVEVRDGLITATLHEGFAVRFGRDDNLKTKLYVVERLLDLYTGGSRESIQYIDVSVPERPSVMAPVGPVY